MVILDIFDVRLYCFNNRKYAINTHSFSLEIKLEQVFCLFSFEVLFNFQV